MRALSSSFLVLIFFLSIPETFAQSQTLSDYYQKKINYQKQGDYKNAAVYGEKMVAQAEKEFGNTNSTYANYTSDLASLYQLMQDYEKAEKWYLLTMEIYKKNLGEGHLYYGTTIFNLALVYQSQKKYIKAEPYFIKTLNIYAENLGKTHDYYQMALNSTIAFYDETDSYGKAETYLEEMLYFIEKKQGKNSKDYAIALSNLGLSCYKNSHSEKAEKSYLASLNLMESVNEKGSEDYSNVCYNLYTLYNTNDRFENATNYLSKYSEYIKKTKGEESKEYAITLSYLGELNRSISRYAEAEQCFSKSINIVEKLEGKSSMNYATLLNNLGYLYKLMGQYDKSETWLTQALTAHEQAVGKNDPSYATVLNNFALLKTAQGKYESAEIYYLQSASIQKVHPESNSEYASTLNNLGLLYTNMGQYSKSYDLLQKALEIKSTTIGKNHHEYANTLINIANLQTERGNYIEAERLYLESLEIYKNASGTQDQKYANNLTNLGMLYFEMGQYEKSIKLHTQALEIKERVLGKEHPEYAASLNFIGICYMNSDKKDLAESFILKSLELRKKVLGNDHPDLAQPMNNLAILYINQGNYTKGAQMLEQCVALAEKAYGTENTTYATFLCNLGSAYESLKKYDKAKSLYQKSLAIREKKLDKNHIRYAEGLGSLAWINVLTNNYDEAEKYYLLANQSYHGNIRNNFPYLSENDKEAFYQDFRVQMNNFYLFAQIRSQKNPTILKEVYNMQLNYKALLLNETKDMRKTILSGNDEKLNLQYQQWIAQREYLAKLYSIDKAELALRGINLEQEEAKAEALEKELAAKSNDFDNLKRRKNIDWKDVQAKLNPNEAAMEIIRVHDKKEDGTEIAGYFALMINSATKENPLLISLDNGGELENQNYKYYINAIRFKTEDKSSYNNYWMKIQQKLSEVGAVSKVYLSCDGVYNKISLPSLLNPTNGKYLLEEMDIQLLSNTKALIQTPNDAVASKGTKQAELYGFPDYNSSEEEKSEFENPLALNRSMSDSLSRFLNFSKIADLPGTEKEVNDIGEILRKNNIKVNVQIKSRASEKFLKQINNPYILHIATHGFFMNDPALEGKVINSELHTSKTKPLLRSGLLLAGVKRNMSAEKNIENEDGIFTAYEALNLDLRNTELVVLSACETGLGEIKNGEGVYGLQRAFEIAGAKTVLMSLWKVNDEATKELMTIFYQRWLETNNKHEAFLYAQKKIREKFNDPYYWAAFVMIGE